VIARAGSLPGRHARQAASQAHATFCKFCDQIYYPCLEATIGRPYVRRRCWLPGTRAACGMRVAP